MIENMYKVLSIVILALIGLTFSAHVGKNDLMNNFDFNSQTGHVVWVFDGDTIAVRLPGNSGNYEANLIGVDAAGWGEDGGSCYALEAAKFLKKLIFKKDVDITWDTGEKVDRRGRLLIYLKINGIDVNEEVIKQGNAWVPRKYVIDKKSIYLEAERVARESKVGLWGSCSEGYLEHRP